MVDKSDTVTIKVREACFGIRGGGVGGGREQKKKWRLVGASFRESKQEWSNAAALYGPQQGKYLVTSTTVPSGRQTGAGSAARRRKAAETERCPLIQRQQRGRFPSIALLLLLVTTRTAAAAVHPLPQHAPAGRPGALGSRQERNPGPGRRQASRAVAAVTELAQAWEPCARNPAAMWPTRRTWGSSRTR